MTVLNPAVKLAFVSQLYLDDEYSSKRIKKLEEKIIDIVSPQTDVQTTVRYHSPLTF